MDEMINTIKNMSIVSKAINTTDESVGDEANKRAKKIQEQKRQRKTKRMEVNK